MNVHDFAPAFTVGDTDLDFTVETTGASQRRVESVATVRCADDNDVVSALHAVHQRQHLRHDATLDLTGYVLTLGADGVDFVDEHDGRSVVSRFVKNLTKLLLGFTVVLRDDLRTVDALEMSVDLRGDGLGDHGLPGAGRAVKQHTLRRVDAESAEQFRMLERQLDHFPHLEQLLTDASNILVRDALGLPNVFLGNGLVLDDDLRVRGDHDDALGHGLNNGERQGLSKQGHAGNEDAVTGDDRALGKASLGKAFNAGPELDLLLVGHHRGDGEFGAGLGVHLPHRDTVAEAHAGVLSNDTVHADDVHLGVFGTTAPVNRSGGALFAADLNEVARLQVQAHFG